jgi:hypothetical protein
MVRINARAENIFAALRCCVLILWTAVAFSVTPHFKDEPILDADCLGIMFGSIEGFVVGGPVMKYKSHHPSK